MAIVRTARKVIFPLDKQLALLPGRFTPLLQEQLTRLGAWMPFAKAVALLASFTHTQVSEASAQRLTESVGLAYEAVQLAEVERIEQDWPEIEPGPDKLLLSVDGAFVPLVRGEWGEVKTLVVGEVGEPRVEDGQQLVPTHTHSYFSRLADAEQFQRLTFGELYRRCVEPAQYLASVSDGAEWIQGSIDFHAPNATRILDFPHAAQRICQIGEAVLGSEHASLRAWQKHQLHQLKHHGASGVLDNLRSFASGHLNVPVVAENLAYLEKREAQMQYPRFSAAGWPIGSGAVESANKVVVEARLKGAGMHWARASVNPMLTLRNAVCNDRWAEGWRQSAEYIQRNGRRWRAIVSRTLTQPEQSSTATPRTGQETSAAEPLDTGRPAASHPWKRPFSPARAQAIYAERRART
jgi:hypothetical protein